MRYGYYPDLAIEEKREKWEKDRKMFLRRTVNALDRLSKKIKFSEAYLFGSLTQQGNFREDSDVDVAFFDLSDKDFFYTMAFLSREIGRDVDVIQLEQHKFKDKILANGIKKWTKS